jgi:hypothetical protein
MKNRETTYHKTGKVPIVLKNFSDVCVKFSILPDREIRHLENP